MQVMVREKRLHGDPVMVRADELSRNGATVRVVLEGQKVPVDVQASEVMQMEGLFGKLQVGRRAQGMIPKAYPTSINALGNQLRK